MANDILNTDLLDKAIIFATKAHSGTGRKSKGFPYIVHPLEVVSIIATMSNNQELLAAGVLHDTVEDCGISLEEIEREFGKKVRLLVDNETDKKIEEQVDDKSEWKVRKQHTIERIANADRDSKIVALGDKLSNIRTIYADYEKVGEDLWKRFRCNSKTDYAWYYVSLVKSLTELGDTDAFVEFKKLVNAVFC